MKAGRAITNRALRHTVKSIQKAARLASLYGAGPASLGTMIHERLHAQASPHIRLCPKEAVNNPIQQTLGRMFRGEFQWRNVPNLPRYEVKNGLFHRVYPELDVAHGHDLGFVIRHVGCKTGRQSTGVNIQTLPRKKAMNKKERNAAIRELDSLESKASQIEVKAAAAIAKDRARLDKLEAALDKKRNKQITARDEAVRPIRRRIQYLRNELAASF